MELLEVLIYSGILAFYVIPIYITFRILRLQGKFLWKLIFCIFLYYLELGLIWLLSFTFDYFNLFQSPYSFFYLVGFNFVWLNPLFFIFFLLAFIRFLVSRNR